MKWSPYQEDIFDWVVNGTGSALVEAVPGAGKTTVLVEAASRTDDALLVAFNNHIAAEMRHRLPGRDVRTLHSLGLWLIQGEHRAHVKESKYYYLLREYWALHSDNRARWFRRAKTSPHQWLIRDDGRAKNLMFDLERLFNLSRATLSYDLELLYVLFEETFRTKSQSYGHFELKIGCHLPTLFKDVLAAGLEQFHETGLIDFADMIAYPITLGIDIPRWPFVFLDEAQDMTRAQICLLSQVVGDRLLMVGDRYQSIYGFAGSSPRSIDELVDRFDPVTLPLSITYRCPSSHLPYMHNVNPAVEVAEWAGPGLAIDGFMLDPEPGDRIMARTNAEVVMLFHWLVMLGYKVIYDGERNMAQELKRHWLDTIEAVELWKDATHMVVGDRAQWGRELQRVTEARYDADFRHQREVLITICHKIIESLLLRHAPHDLIDKDRINDITETIEDIYRNDGEDAVYVSTFHRSKGKEADTVYLYGYRTDTLVSSIPQERNLYYVAVSRAKKALVFLGNDLSIVPVQKAPIYK